MRKFTITVTVSATGNESAFGQSLCAVLQAGVNQIVARAVTFRSQEISPKAMFDLEESLRLAGRELLRNVVECVLQHVEPANSAEAPARIRTSFADEYRCRPKSRLALATLFGEVSVHRLLYESLLPGEACLFPLDLWIGVGAGHVSPGLLEKIGRLAADNTQGDVIKTVKQEHGVKLSVGRLRTIIAGASQQVAPFILDARVERLKQLLQAAFASRGKHLPTLVVGRDGCDIAIYGEKYKVAATATVSVFDRRGKRLGTVYLGRMPEENQVSLTRELSEVLLGLMKAWTGKMPRLAYVTDSGYQESHYWSMLRRMRHPVTGKRLAWERIVDFYHACQYVNRLGTAVFGEGREANRWFRKMRRWMRDELRGVHRVLNSAAALRLTRGPLTGKALKEFETCFRYLSKRLRFLNFHDYRKRGLPIGSGVTEAACKIVFTQRFKRSGMTWKRESGQHILNLRTLTLSGLWSTVFQASLKGKTGIHTLLKQRAKGPMTHILVQNAA